MRPQAKRYDHVKSWSKRLRQGLFRFCIYGALLVAGEVAFYTITKIGRSIEPISFLFTYQWLVDPSLELHHIWDVPIHTFFGQASLYMFFVYGAICVLGLEPAYRWMRRKDVPVLLRGVVYMFIILSMECSLGWVLKALTGLSIWYYDEWGTIFVYTSWAIAPMWFLCGLISENVINLIDSFDELKMTFYGLAPTETGKRNRIYFLSDVHIGPKGTDGKPAGWFYGIYEVYLTILLYKIAMDKRARELVFVGDLFDTWVYPPDQRPMTARQTIEAWLESPFMPPLRMCIERLDAVWYIPGNHDMHVRPEDVEILSSGGKRVQLTDSASFEKTHTLRSGTRLVIEHGNGADFFNAPDVHPDALCGLPFGYFVARLFAAADEYETGVKLNVERAMLGAYKRVLSETIVAKPNESKESRTGKLFIRFFVDALILYVNTKLPEGKRLDDSTRIYMPQDEGTCDDFVTVRQIKESYWWLLDEWRAGKKTSMLVAAGKNGLEGHARKQFGERDWKLWFSRLFSWKRPDLIVILGHTHYAKLEYVMDRELQGIYANTGAICRNGKQDRASWVMVTDGDARPFVKLGKL